MIGNHKATPLFNPMGMRVIVDSQLVEPDGTVDVRRTWRERLFSIPWRPLEATKPVQTFRPSREVIQVNGRLLMHPVTWKKMVEELDKSHGN